MDKKEDNYRNIIGLTEKKYEEIGSRYKDKTKVMENELYRLQEDNEQKAAAMVRLTEVGSSKDKELLITREKVEELCMELTKLKQSQTETNFEL